MNPLLSSPRRVSPSPLASALLPLLLLLVANPDAQAQPASWLDSPAAGSSGLLPSSLVPPLLEAPRALKSEPEPALRADPVEGLAAAVAAHAYRTSGVVDEAELTARVGTFAFFHGAPSDHHDAKACQWSAAAPNLGACITPTAISWHLTSPAPGPVPGPLPDGALAVHEESLSEVFFGANPRAAIVPEGGLVGTLDDRRGPLDGHTLGLPLTRAVRIAALWPGVDLVLERTAHGYKRTWEVAPGGAAHLIAHRFDGAESVRVTPDGELEVLTPLGSLVETPPVAWQPTAAGAEPVHAAWAVDGLTARLVLGAYDPGLPLLIDPHLSFTSPIRGTALFALVTATARLQPPNEVEHLALGGTLVLPDLTRLPVDHRKGVSVTGSDGFVALLRTTAPYEIRFVLLGGTRDDGYTFPPHANGLGGSDAVGALAVSADGLSLFVGGHTSATDFPVTAGAFQTERGDMASDWPYFPPPSDLFVVRLDALGATYGAATLYGGDESEIDARLALLPEGSLALGGTSWFRGQAGADAGIVIFDSGLSRLVGELELPHPVETPGYRLTRIHQIASSGTVPAPVLTALVDHEWEEQATDLRYTQRYLARFALTRTTQGPATQKLAGEAALTAFGDDGVSVTAFLPDGPSHYVLTGAARGHIQGCPVPTDAPDLTDPRPFLMTFDHTTGACTRLSWLGSEATGGASQPEAIIRGPAPEGGFVIAGTTWAAALGIRAAHQRLPGGAAVRAMGHEVFVPSGNPTLDGDGFFAWFHRDGTLLTASYLGGAGRELGGFLGDNLLTLTLGANDRVLLGGGTFSGVFPPSTAGAHAWGAGLPESGGTISLPHRAGLAALRSLDVAALKATVAFPEAVARNEVIRGAIGLNNEGPRSAPNVRAVLSINASRLTGYDPTVAGAPPLPAGCSWLPREDPTIALFSMRCELGTLARDAARSLPLSLPAATTRGTLLLTVSAHSDRQVPDPVEEPPVTEIVIGGHDLAIDASVLPERVATGGTARLRWSVRNAGPEKVGPMLPNDPPSPRVIRVTPTPAVPFAAPLPAGCAATTSPAGVECTVTSLEVDAELTYELPFTAPSEVGKNRVIRVEALQHPEELNRKNDVKEASYTVESAELVVISAGATPTPINPGEETTLIVDYANVGPVAAEEPKAYLSPDGLRVVQGGACVPATAPNVANAPAVCPLGGSIAPGETRSLSVTLLAPEEPAVRTYAPRVQLDSKGFVPAQKTSPQPSHAQVPICVGCVDLALVSLDDGDEPAKIPAGEPATFQFRVSNEGRVRATNAIVEVRLTDTPAQRLFPLEIESITATQQGSAAVTCGGTGSTWRCTLPELAAGSGSAQPWVVAVRGIPRRGVAQVVAEVVSADQPLTPPVATTGSTGARLRGEVTRTVDIPAIQGRIWKGEPLKLHERSVVLFDLTTRNGTLTPGGQLVLAWQAGDFEQALVQHMTNHELETGATSSIDAALTCQATGTAGLTCPLPRLGRGVVAGFRVSFVPKVPGQRALNLGITIPPHLEATFEPAAETLRVRGVDLSFELTAIETAVGKLLESPPTLRNTGLVDAIAELSVAWDPAVFVWEGTPPCGSVDAQVGQLVCTTTLPAGESAPIPWSLKALKRAPQAFVTVMALTQPATDEETPQNNSAIVTVKVKGPDLTIAFEPPSTPTPVGELVEGVTVELKNQDANAEARNAGFSYQWDPTIFRWEGALECVGQGLLDQSLGLANCRYTDPIPPQGTRALPWSFRVLKRDKAKQTITVKAVLEPLTDDENPADNTRPIALEVAPADLRLTDGFDVSPPALRVGEPRIDTPLLSFTNAGGSRVGDIALTCTWPNATLRVTDLRVVLPAGGATLCPLVTENGKTGADCVIPGPIAPSEGFVVHGTVTGRERSMAAPLSCWARSQDKTIEDNLVDNAPSTTFSVEGIDARIVFNAPTGEVLAKEDTLLGAELRVVGEGAIEGARLLFDTPIADAAFVEVSVSGGAGPCTTDTTTGRVTCPVPKLVEGAGEIVSIAWRAKRPKTNVPLTVSWDPETVPKLASTAKPSEVLSLSPRGVRFEPTVTVTTDEPLLVRPALGFDFKINAAVTNTGPRTAEGVVLEIDHDIPSAGVSVVGAPGCSFDPATQRHRCEIAELEQGASVTRTLTLRAERKVPKFLATAFVKNGDVELVEAESKSSAEAGGQIQGADLVPIVVTPPELDMGGDPVALTFSVINTGPGKATTPGFELSFDERFHELALNNAACDPPTVAPGSNTAKMGCRWQGLVLAPTEVSDEIILYFKGKKPSRQAAISVVASQVPTDDEEDKANDIVPRALPVRGPDLAPSIPAPLPPLGRGVWTSVTVTVENHGKAAASGGTLRVIHPTAGALRPAGATGCTVTSNMMTCTDIDLPAPTAGQGPPVVTRTIEVRVSEQVATTPLTLQVALPDEQDEEPLNDNTTVTLVVEGPDLAVDGVGPSEPWGVGQARDVTVTLQNLGPGLAERAKFVMTWDAQALEPTDGTGLRLPAGCTVPAPHRAECELTDLEPGWSLSLPLELRALAARPRTEVRLEAATVPAGGDPRAANNLKLVPLSLKGRDLRASATLAAEVRLDKTTSLVATATNTAGIAVENVELEILVDSDLKIAEPLPADCQRRPGGVRCAVGTLGANASSGVSVTLEGDKVAAAASVRVIAKPTEGDDTPADNEATRQIRVLGPDLAAAVEPMGLFDSEVARGQEVTLRATVTSKGARAHRSELALTFSRSHLDYLGFTTNGQPGDACAVSTAAPDRVVCAVTALGDSLDPGADQTTRHYDLRFRAKGHGLTSGQVLVTPIDPAGDEVPGDNQAGYALTVRGADLVLTATSTPAFPPTGVGAESLATFVVTNAGPGDSEPSTRLRLLFPGADLGLVQVALMGNALTCQPAGGGFFACPLGVIPHGAAPRHLTVRFEGQKAGAHPVELALLEDSPDEAPSDNVQQVEVQVDGADLGVVMAVAPTTLGTQQAATFTATVTNHGPRAADNSRIAFTIPAGLRFDAGLVDGVPRCFAAGGALVVCQLGDTNSHLANGASTVVTLTTTATAAGVHTVSATASSDTGDPGGAPATAQASATVSQSLDSDGDGVPDADEDSAPGGDGNGDGIPDAQQPHVASVKSPQGHVATIEAPPGTQLGAASRPAPTPWPTGLAFPMDALELSVPVPTPGSLVTVKVYFPWSVPLWAFWKYAPTTAGGPPLWWEFTWDGTTGARLDASDPNLLLVTFQDGGRGDADGLANGVVKDPLAPALPHLRVNDAGDAPDADPGDGSCATAPNTCTLRAAIMEANASSAPAFVDFAFTGVPGQLAAFDIALESALPAVAVPVVIDATRQPVERSGLIGGAILPLSVPDDQYPDPVFTAEIFAHWPRVALRPFRELDTSPAPFDAPLLDLQAPRSSVHGLLLFHGGGDGVRLSGERCLVSGVAGLWNAGASVHLANASRCRVTDNALLGDRGSPTFEPDAPSGGVRAVGGSRHAIVSNHLGLLPGTTRRGRMAQRFGVSLEGASEVRVVNNRVSNALHAIALTDGAHDNLVTDNVLGLDSAGGIARYVLGRLNENGAGLLITGGAHDNTFANNAIPNASFGVHLAGGAHHNILISNRIGTLPTGACPTDGPGFAWLESCSGAEIFAETCPTLPPSCRDVATTWAVLVEGGAHHNSIGQAEPASGNTLLGDVGVELRGTATADNRFEHNLVGVQAPLDSHARVGVRVFGGTDNRFIGGHLASVTVDGRFPESTGLVSGTRFEELTVGLTPDGAPFMPSQTRAVTVLGATDTSISEIIAAPGSGGVLSFSEVDGLIVRDSALGVDGRGRPLRSGGDVALGFGGSRGVVFERATLVGGAGAGLHLRYDRLLTPSTPVMPHEVSVLDSTIGATPARPDAGHLGSGLRVEAPGTYFFDDNLIGGNGEHGIWLHANTGWDFDGQWIEATVTRNTIGVSRDGLTPLPNAGSGVVVWDTIGGPVVVGADKDTALPAPLGNLIAHNGGFGVLGVAGGPATVRGNRFFDNARLPVTLGGPSAMAPLPNDAGDADAGLINGSQNHPNLTGRTGLSVTGLLDSGVGSYLVDVYAVLDPDPSGHGEGGLWLGSAPVTITTAGATPFDVTLIAEPPQNAPLTAMATLVSGTFAGATSEQGPSRCLAADTPNLVTSMYFTRNLSLTESIPVGDGCTDSGCPVFRAHVRVDNVGDAAASGVTVTLDLPPEVRALTPPSDHWGAGWSCTLDGPRVSCALSASLAAGATSIAEVRLEGVSAGAARLETTAATATLECTTFDNASAGVILVAPRPFEVAFINAPPTTFVGQGLVDQPIVGLARVTHGVVPGDASSLTGAVLTLESEAGTPVAGFDPACRVVGATIECTFEDLAPNTILDVPFAFRFAEPGQHPVRATLSAASPPLDASQTTKSGLVNALASGLDLAVTLEGPARQTVEVGERVSFRFVLANLGTTTETNIIVSGSGFQHLNDRTFTLVDGQGAEACFNADQLCGFFALAPGEFRTIEVSGVFAEPATRTFSASHNKASADLQVRNNTATVEGTAVPATGCPAGQTRFVAFEDDAEADRAVFESVPVYAVRTDFGGGYQSATSWRTVVEQFPVDFDPNLGWISEERGGILRTAAPVEVPAGAGEARFGFWRFQELALQGANAHAVVEYALGAGPHSENDWQDGMPLVVAGASESLAQSGPFAGRYVWAGNSSLDINGGRLWSRTELDLAPLAGEFVSLRLRVRMTTSFGNARLYADDLALTGCAGEPPPPAAAQVVLTASPSTLTVGDTNTVTVTATTRAAGEATLTVGTADVFPLALIEAADATCDIEIDAVICRWSDTETDTNVRTLVFSGSADAPGFTALEATLELASGGDTVEASATRVVSVTAPPTPDEADLRASFGVVGPMVAGVATFTATLDNLGPAASGWVRLRVSASGAGAIVSTDVPFGCDDTGEAIVCEVDLEADTLATWPFTVTAAESGLVTLTAVVERPDGVEHPLDPDPSNDVATLVLVSEPPGPPRADLGVALVVSPALVPLGEGATVELSITNAGPAAASDASLSAMVPLGVGLELGQTPCTRVGELVSCVLGSLVASSTTSLSWVVSPSAGGTLLALVSAATADPNPDNDLASATFGVLMPVAAPALTLTAPASVLVGTPVSLALRVDNLGEAPSAPTAVELQSDDLLATLLGDGCEPDGPGRVRCLLAPIAPLAAHTFALTASSARPGPLGLSARLVDGAATPVSASVMLRPVVRDRALSATPLPSELLLEETRAITLALDVTGEGPSAPATVGVSTSGAVLSTTDPRCTPVGVTLACTLSASPGLSDAVTLGVRASSPGLVTLTARLDPDPADADPGDDLVTLSTPAVAPPHNLAVSVSGPTSLSTGAAATFPVRVTNTGASAATTTLRLGLSGATSTLPSGCSAQPDGALACGLGPIAPGAWGELPLSVTAELAGAVVLIASLPVGGDDDPSDDLTARFAFATDPPRDLAVALVAPGSAPWGEALDLSLVITARRATHDAVLTLDALGALDTPTSDDPRCTPVDDARLACSLGELAPGEEVIIPARALAALVGEGQLIASIDASGPSLSPEDDLALATVLVDSGAALTLSWQTPARVSDAGESFTAHLTAELARGGFDADAFGDIVLNIEITGGDLASADPRCSALEVHRWACLLDPGLASPGPSFEVMAGEGSELVLMARALSVGRAGTFGAEHEARVRVGGPVADLGVTLSAPSADDLLSPHLSRLVVAELSHLGGDPVASARLSWRLAGLVPALIEDGGSGCVPEPGGWSCPVGPLSEGETAEVRLLLTPREEGPLALVATLSSEAFDPSPDNDTATLETVVGRVTADRSVGLSGPTALVVGAEATFTVTLGQAGPAPLAPVGVRLLVPPGLALSAASPTTACFEVAGAIECPPEPLAAGASRVLTLTLRATGPGLSALVALVTGPVADPSAIDDAASLVLARTVDCAALNCETSELAEVCAVATCAPLTGCVVALAEDGASCDAGPCVVGASCLAGQCLGAPRVCDGSASCQVGACDPERGCVFEDAPIRCDDGDACTVLDLCIDRQCQGFSPLACDDGNACTADGCGEHGCVSTPLTGSPCELADACVFGASCEAGQCVATSIRECEDDDPCTVDGCGPGGCEHLASEHPACAGECAPERAAARCEGGDLVWVDACGETRETAVSCDDGEPATTDRCDPDLGLCVRRLTGDLCACEGEWEARCEGGALMWFDPCGLPAGVADPCVSADPCVASVCDESRAVCVETVVEDGACRPAAACGQDASLSCDGGSLVWRDGCGLEAGLAIACDEARDGAAEASWTTGTCDPTTLACVRIADPEDLPGCPTGPTEPVEPVEPPGDVGPGDELAESEPRPEQDEDLGPLPTEPESDSSVRESSGCGGCAGGGAGPWPLALLAVFALGRLVRVVWSASQASRRR